VDSAAGQQSGQPARSLVTAAAYVMLFLLGAMEGVVGCFYHASGPGPLAALAFDALLLTTSLLAASGMRRPAGGLMPAVGWFLASFVLAMGTKGGSVVIANTNAGKWFLFGGSASAAAGAVAAFARWSRPAPAGRRWPARRKTGQ
jgi:Family of unknown function (DUF6113)